MGFRVVLVSVCTCERLQAGYEQQHSVRYVSQPCELPSEGARLSCRESAKTECHARKSLHRPSKAFPEPPEGEPIMLRTIQVLVPEKCGSHLIGQKGERVKTLCQAPHSLRGLSWGGGRDEVYFFQIWGLCKAWRVGPSRTCSVKVLWRPGFRHLASVVTA